MSSNYIKDLNVIVLEGKILKNIDYDGYTMTVETESGKTFRFYHDQDCCESVGIYNVNGEISNILNSPILSVVETINHDDWPTDVPKPEYLESYTWTTFQFTTSKGSVSVRWLGESNGYYSESVSFCEIKSKNL